MKTKTHLKAGLISMNHNETLARSYHGEKRITESLGQMHAARRLFLPPRLERTQHQSALARLWVAGGLLLSLTWGTPFAGAGPCMSGADATMTVSDTEYFDVQISNGTLYSQNCLADYTVDINVPVSTSAPFPGRFVILSGGFAGTAQLLTQSNCALASETITIRKRTYDVLHGWGDWHTIHNQTRQGTWGPSLEDGRARSHCALSDPYTVLAPMSWIETDQYRVFVRPLLAGRPVQAFVAWEGW